MAKSDVLVRMKADTTGYDANIAKARRQLDQFKRDNLTAGGALKQLSGTLMSTAAKFASVTAAVGALGMAFKNNIETARNFEKSMSQLSSLTGMVGNDLGKLKEYAIELGSSTTLSASQVADAFKMIGSQQPQLLASGEALKAVTKNAITLSEAAGIELSEAAKTLSVSINQMGGDSANAERYINVLAAAAQKGAGDIVWLGEAITKSGTTAKAVGTDYEELVANLEQLAKAGYDASTAGTALRSIIMNLEKQSNQNFKPSVVGLTQAFKNLGQANLTLTQYQELTGKMFAAQAKALADAAGEAENMKEQITGTNIAEEKAKTNTDNLDGALKGLASAWEGLNLHINSSNGLLRDAVDWLKDVVTWADKAYQALERYYKGPESFDDKMNRMAEEYDQSVYEIPEVTVTGKKPAPKPSPIKTPKSGGSGKTNVPTYAADSIAAQQALVQQLTKQWNEAGAEVRNSYIQPLVEAEAKLKQMKDEQALLKAQAEGKFNAPKLWQGDIDDMLGNTKGTTKLADTIIQPIDEIRDYLAKNPIKVPIETAEDKVNALKVAAKNTADVVGTIGQAFNAIEDPAAKVAAIVAQAIANVALAYSDALAKDQAGKFNIWRFIAGAAAATISMATTIASIHQATGYSEGGIVKGNTYSNDQIPAMLNAGEVVLNASQQNMLAQNLKGSGGGGGYSPSYVSGEQIWIALNAYAKRTGKGEIVTWR